MTSPQARKGAQAEREAAAVLSDLLGFTIRRRHNIGTHEDIGDLLGLPDTTVEVKHRASVADSVRLGLADLEREQAEAGTTFGVVMVRLPRGGWAMVQTPEAFAAMWREATS